MTDTQFRQAIPSFESGDFAVIKNNHSCWGQPITCKNCTFRLLDGECAIYGKDTLTHNQLKYLKEHLPELFI